MQWSSQNLRAKIGLCVGPLDTVFSELWGHRRPDQMVPAFLVLLHQVMRTTVPLMECALQRCGELKKSDALAKALEPYYRRHIDEERDHERWTLADLTAAGFDPDFVLSSMPSPELSKLVGAQYYWILHCHPFMLLGYIGVLEANPPKGDQIDKIRDASGLPEAAFRTVRMHGELDLNHRSEFDALLDGLPLTQRQIEMISLNVFQTTDALAASVQALKPIDWKRDKVTEHSGSEKRLQSASP